jgi:hypothetical protein
MTKIVKKSQLDFNKIISDLEQKLSIAQKDKELILKELYKNIEMVQYHCKMVEENTGSITQEDIVYSLNLLTRVMKQIVKNN